jgi:hypothetical protein
MPTGYTAIIEERDDLTFRDFALRCARAMTACLPQRDDPPDELPRVLETSDYHIKAARKAEAQLVELLGLSQESTRALWQSDCESIAKSNEVSIAKAKEFEKRYARMRAKVEAWKPAPDYEGLRRFMLQQIDACVNDWTSYIVELTPTPSEWLAKQIAGAKSLAKYHTERHKDEVKRTDACKEWIESLYASLSEANE